MDLVPCVHCSRHVGASETTCPFCQRNVAAQRPQAAFVAKLTRAAIFSAAVIGPLGACDSKTAKPTPAPVPQQTGSATGSGSDELEKMLDADTATVDHPAVTDGGAPLDAELMAATDDAGVDAGTAARPPLTPEQIRDRREQLRLDSERAKDQLRKRQQINAKPYGAPPARRRVV